MRRDNFTRRMIIACLFCVVLPPFAAQAQTPSMQDWTFEDGGTGPSTLKHKSGNAQILVGPMDLTKGGGVVPALQVMARTMDKPEGCVGISKARPTPASGVAGGMMVTSDAGLRCTIIIAPVKDGAGLMVFGIEAPAGNYGARQLALFTTAALVKKMGGSAQVPATTAAQAQSRPVTATRPPVVTSAPGQLARSSPPKGLIGMWRSDWVENQYRAFSGLTLVALDNTLIFTAGGYFFNGVPSSVGIDDAGAQAIMRNEPNAAGRYTIGNGIITLNYSNGETETVKAKRNGQDWDLIFRGKQMSPKRLFNSGGGLRGVWSTERITNAGSGTFVVGNDDFDFSLDGRFAKGGSVSFSSSAVSSIGGRNVRRGTYVIRNSALYLSYSDGESEVYSLFQETPGDVIWFNDQMYKPAGSE